MLTYQELLQRRDAPAGSSWGLFGPDDEVGTLNFITAECVRAAAQTVRKGTHFNLDLPLDAFDPPLFAHRGRPRHTIFSNGRHHRDDRIDDFYPQASSQLDGLRHMRHPLHDFYNGVDASRIAPGDPSLGINRLAERGIVGRGLLLDVAGHLEAQGRGMDHRAGEAFPVSLLQEVCEAQNSPPRPGDILLVRTGWLKHYFELRTAEERRDFPAKLRASGLVQSHETLRWLWDQRFSVLAFDNVGVEALPSVPDSPFVVDDAEGRRVASGLMHPFLIGMMGFILGELWDLEALARDCAADGVYECLVVSKALNLVGGVGSPANATAIK
jgi:kynurenine formamidase